MLFYFKDSIKIGHNKGSDHVPMDYTKAGWIAQLASLLTAHKATASVC
jgi:hypothetical protein